MTAGSVLCSPLSDFRTHPELSLWEGEEAGGFLLQSLDSMAGEGSMLWGHKVSPKTTGMDGNCPQIAPGNRGDGGRTGTPSALWGFSHQKGGSLKDLARFYYPSGLVATPTPLKRPQQCFLPQS